MSEILVPVITFSEKKENKTQEARKGMGCQHVLLTRDLQGAHRIRPSLSHFICHPTVISCLLETKVPPDRNTKNIPDVVFRL